MLAEKVVFFGRCKTGVRISGPYHAELIWIHAEFLFQLQALLECLTSILVLQHLRLLGVRSEVGLVPGFIIGKLVVRRKIGMRLAVALNLGHLVKGLPADTGFGILAGKRFARHRINLRKHEAVAQVARASSRPPVFSS